MLQSCGGAGKGWRDGWIIEYKWDAWRFRTHSSDSSDASNWYWVQSEAGGSERPHGTAVRPRRVPLGNGWFKGFMKWPHTSPAINGVALAVQSDQAQMIAGSAGFTAPSSTEIKMSHRDSWPVRTPELWPWSPACMHVFVRTIKKFNRLRQTS